ncbi:MAG: Acetyl-CoA acetyltransferase, partial [uncultured Ramlibacter sp.]
RRSAGRFAACLRQVRIRHGGQCFRHQRRRGRRRGDERQEGRCTGPEAAGAHRRLRHVRARPRHHGHGPGAGVAQGAAARRLERAGRQPLRAERSLRGPGLRREQGTRHRPGQGQRQRRRHRHRSSDRRLRLPHPGDAAARDAAARGEEGIGRAVHRRRHGGFPRSRTGL